MRLQLLSDLHLESNPGFTPEPAPDADLLVLAGDIGSYQSGSALSTLDDPDFGLGRFSPLRGWPVPVRKENDGRFDIDITNVNDIHHQYKVEQHQWKP